jgi:hypothetical protein
MSWQAHALNRLLRHVFKRALLGRLPKRPGAPAGGKACAGFAEGLGAPGCEDKRNVNMTDQT